MVGSVPVVVSDNEEDPSMDRVTSSAYPPCSWAAPSFYNNNSGPVYHREIIIQLGYNFVHIANPFSPLFYPHCSEYPAPSYVAEN